jgi:hypothetical protein
MKQFPMLRPNYDITQRHVDTLNDILVSETRGYEEDNSLVVWDSYTELANGYAHAHKPVLVLVTVNQYYNVVIF